MASFQSRRWSSYSLGSVKVYNLCIRQNFISFSSLHGLMGHMPKPVCFWKSVSICCAMHSNWAPQSIWTCMTTMFIWYVSGLSLWKEHSKEWTKADFAFANSHVGSSSVLSNYLHLLLWEQLFCPKITQKRSIQNSLSTKNTGKSKDTDTNTLQAMAAFDRSEGTSNAGMAKCSSHPCKNNDSATNLCWHSRKSNQTLTQPLNINKELVL